MQRDLKGEFEFRCLILHVCHWYLLICKFLKHILRLLGIEILFKRETLRFLF